MTNFVVDNTALPFPKTDGQPLGAAANPNQWLQAAEWNSVCQASIDLRGAIQTIGTVGVGVNVKDFGAIGDWDPTLNTGTDNYAAFTGAFASAISSGDGVRIPPGNYKLSKVVTIANAADLNIQASAFASIYYPSDDLTLIGDSAHNNSYNIIRSGFWLTGCRDVVIEGLEFVGGNTQELTYANVGAGVYASRCVGTRLINCRARFGTTLFVQDANPSTSSASGAVLAVSAGIVTLTNSGDVNTPFNGGMVGRQVAITNSTNPVNDGRFQILTVISSTQLTYANSVAVAEATSPLIWLVVDGDDDTKLLNCRWDNCRVASYTGNGGTFENCTFVRPGTADMTGIPDSFTFNGTSVTMLDASAIWDATLIGRFVKIAGSTSNDGLFQITGATSRSVSTPATVTFANGSGVTELAPFSSAMWWICGAERVGKGGGSGAISSASGVVTFTSLVPIFRPTDVGKTLVITDATSIINNGNKPVTRYISATQIQYVQTGAVSEAFAQIFSIDSYDTSKGDSAVGPPITSTTTSVAAHTLSDTTLTAIVNAYAGRYLIDSVGRQWLIASNTATVFTLVGSGTPASGVYTVVAGSTYGSSHAIYYFAGRSRIVIDGCIFRGIRTVGVKISGSALPIRDIEVCHCLFELCGSGIVAGADDAQEHIDMNFHHNRFVDCGGGRAGWSEQTAITLLGARNTKITHNQFYASREAVAAHVNTGAIGGYYGILASRFLESRTQPLEDVTIAHNTFVGEPTSTNPGRITTSAILVEHAGQWGKAATNGVDGNAATLTRFDSGAQSLTITASSGTMVRTAGSFVADGVHVGSALAMSGFSNGGNNTTKTVSAVNTTTVTFTSNAGLVNETSASAHFATSVMTLLDSDAAFSQQDVGSTIQICNAPDSGNNSTTALETKVGEWVVMNVTATSSLTFNNSNGVGNHVSAGTYRIKPTKRRRGGTCMISHNQIAAYGGTGISTVGCTAPQIIGNIIDGTIAIADDGSVSPNIANNIELTSPNNGARIQVSIGTSWPIIMNNFVTNGALSGGNLTNENTATRSDMGVGVGNSTSVDYPLLGLRGRAVSTNGRAEMVLAFGSGHFDGDTLAVNGNIFTYKSTSPDNGTGGTFATAVGLIACLDATARAGNSLGSLGLDCADYGAAFATPVTTGHIRIRGHVPINTANQYFIDTINVLNPTALVIPRNDVGSGEALLYSRGEGTAEPFASATFTTTFALNQVNLTAHGYVTGDGPVRLTTTTTLPSGFSLLTDYWVIVTGANTFKLATSSANALAGTNVTISDDGTGTHTITNTLARRMVIWTMQTSFAGGMNWSADSAASAIVLRGGWFQERNVNNAGCCAIMRTLTTQGTEEYRWTI